MFRALNIGNARALIQGNSKIILVAYAGVYIGLSYLAKKLGDGLDNPIRTVKWARILHFTSLAIFVCAFLLYYKYNPSFIYLMILSFPVDVIAIILAYNATTTIEKRDDLLDD